MLGNFHDFLLSADFFKVIIFEKFFLEYQQSVKMFGPDLGPNCLQRLSEHDTSRVKVG